MPLSKREKDALLHLGYEWWMFRAMYDLAHGRTEDDPVRFAMFESYGVHGRALIDFFYRTPEQDDLSATDVKGAKQLTTPKKVSDWRIAVNKRIAHVTATRFDLQSKWTDWNEPEVYAALKARIAEVKTAFAADMPTGDYWARPTTSSILKDPIAPGVGGHGMGASPAAPPPGANINKPP